MRILFLSQLLPLPLDAGPKIRAYYVLRYLAEAGHELTLVCFTRPGDDERNVHRLRRICRSVETVPLVRSRLKDVSNGLHSLFSATPFLILRDQLPSMRQKLEQIIDSHSFDALHADQLWMAPYIMETHSPSLKVLDQHNAVHMIPRRLANRARNPLTRAVLFEEASKLETFERRVCKIFDRVVWVSKEDQAAVCVSGNERLSRDCVIPIATEPFAKLPLRSQQPFRITFVGGMHWPPNAEGVSWFVEKIWPKVTFAVPSAVLTLIGKGTPKKLGRLGAGSNVELAGYVSDLERHLSETAAFIVPLRSGAGMRVKILDAWSWGLPVISTSLGAEGIKTTAGENLLVADDEESFANSLIQVMRDRNLARRLSENGRTTVETLYDWKNVYKAWDQIYH
jgi:glycosyltransferase involved in cell wall biosynthesis